MAEDDSVPVYALEPSAFRSMQEAQEMTVQLEDNLTNWDLGAAHLRPEVVETFSKIVSNAAEHGMTDNGAHAHVRYMPHRRGQAFDIVVADSGPGIRATLKRNPALEPTSDTQALSLAIQELVSGTGNPARGTGLWITTAEMRKAGRRMQLHSGAALLVMYGQNEPETRESEYRQGTLVRLTIPC